MKSLLIATVLTLSGLAVGQPPQITLGGSISTTVKQAKPCDQIPVGGHIYTAGHCEGYETLPVPWRSPQEGDVYPGSDGHIYRFDDKDWKIVDSLAESNIQKIERLERELAALKQRVAELEKAWLKAAKGEPDAIRYGHACGQDERLVPTQDINISTHTTTLSWTCVKWWAEAAGK